MCENLTVKNQQTLNEEECKDYLKIDPEIKGQKFVLLSFTRPVKDENDNFKVKGIKVRGVFDTEDKAREYSQKLSKLDNTVNIYIGDVGVWLPFYDDPSNALDGEYQKKELNDYMKKCNEDIQNQELEFNERKKKLINKEIDVVNDKQENNVSVFDDEINSLKNMINDIENKIN